MTESNTAYSQDSMTLYQMPAKSPTKDCALQHRQAQCFRIPIHAAYLHGNLVNFMTNKTKFTVRIHHYGGQVPSQTLQSASCAPSGVHHDELRCVRYANTSCETARRCQHQRPQVSVRQRGKLSYFASQQTLRSPPVKVSGFRRETISTHTQTSAPSTLRECVVGTWSRGELKQERCQITAEFRYNLSR